MRDLFLLWIIAIVDPSWSLGDFDLLLSTFFPSFGEMSHAAEDLELLTKVSSTPVIITD